MQDESAPSKTSFWGSLTRAQVASVIATLLDNLVYFLANELLGLWYVAATALGAFCGAVCHFILSRTWVFRSKHRPWHDQAWRYVLVSSGSLLLNTAGVTFFTEVVGLHNHISKVVTGLLVGLFYNFLLHRYFVFKR